MHQYYDVNEEGHSIRCKVYYKDKSHVENAIIFGTGFAGHKDNNAANGFADKVLSKYKNTIIVVFNWPAHGDDVKKKISLEDCDTYLRLVIGDVKSRFGVEKLYSYATSFGGYLVLKYISENGNPFQKIALRCPAVDMYDVITKTIMKGDEFEKLSKNKSIQVGFDRKVTVTKEFFDSLKENDLCRRDFIDYAEDILILHGTKDEVVPFESSRQFADDNIIEFITVEGADHRFQNPSHMGLANKSVMEFFFGSK